MRLKGLEPLPEDQILSLARLPVPPQAQILERVMGIEPTSKDWKSLTLTVVLYPHKGTYTSVQDRPSSTFNATILNSLMNLSQSGSSAATASIGVTVHIYTTCSESWCLRPWFLCARYRIQTRVLWVRATCSIAELIEHMNGEFYLPISFNF